MAQTLAIQMQPAGADVLVRACQIRGAWVLHAITRAEQTVGIGQGQVGVLHRTGAIHGDRDHLYRQPLAAQRLDLSIDVGSEYRRVGEANQMVGRLQFIEQIVLIGQANIEQRRPVARPVGELQVIVGHRGELRIGIIVSP